jgi:hypothetical protein
VKVELATGWIEEPKCVEAVVEPVAVPATPVIEAEVVSNDTSWADELEKGIFTNLIIDAGLTDDEIVKVRKKHEAKVNAFLVAKGQIVEGLTFRDISDEGYRNRVLSNTPRFIDAVLKEVA